MDALASAMNWGSPLGLGLFFLLSGAGANLSFRGLSRLAAQTQRNQRAPVSDLS